MHWDKLLAKENLIRRAKNKLEIVLICRYPSNLQSEFFHAFPGRIQGFIFEKGIIFQKEGFYIPHSFLFYRAFLWCKECLPRAKKPALQMMAVLDSQQSKDWEDLF